MNGKEVQEAIKQSLPAGTYINQVDVNNLSGNIYLIVFTDIENKESIFKIKK